MKSYKKTLVISLLLIMPTTSLLSYYHIRAFHNYSLSEDVTEAIRHFKLDSRLHNAIRFSRFDDWAKVAQVTILPLAAGYYIYSQYQQEDESEVETESTTK